MDELPRTAGQQTTNFFLKVGTYLLLFPAIACLSYATSGWVIAPAGPTVSPGLALIFVFGYILLAIPAFLTGIVDFLLHRSNVRFRPLLVTIVAVTAAEIGRRHFDPGIPDLTVCTAIAGLACCLVASRY